MRTNKRLIAALLTIFFFIPVFGLSVNCPAFAGARKKPIKRPLKKRRLPRYVNRAVNHKITQKYVIKEALNNSAVDAVKSMGAEEARIDAAQNVLSVSFDTRGLSSIEILTRLKSLGYTVSRID